MPRNLWTRGIVVLVVLLGSVWYLYPPKQTLNLGLDLQGGIHLVLGVQVDKHVASQTDRAAEDLKAQLERKGIAARRIAREGNATIAVELASPQAWNDLLTVAGEFQRFERRNEEPAAGRLRLVMSEAEIRRLRDDAVRQGLETIRNRVDQFGVAEPVITRQGAERILIQLPGVQDPTRAKALIGRTALLEFKLLDERTPVEEALKGSLPESSEVLYQRRVDKATKTERNVPYVVQKRTLLTAAERPRAADSVRQGLIAITASAAVVFVFMLFYYRLSGLIADVALGLNLLILFAAMAAFGATLTLPGLAGIALTVGMAVDTNILIFERIREELRLGKTPRSAVDAGFTRALRTIIDTHLTVMVTAAILYNFGTGSVKGFAVSLFVGLAASLFTAYFFTRLLFDLAYVGRRKVEAISI